MALGASNLDALAKFDLAKLAAFIRKNGGYREREIMDNAQRVEIHLDGCYLVADVFANDGRYFAAQWLANGRFVICG